MGRTGTETWRYRGQSGGLEWGLGTEAGSSGPGWKTLTEIGIGSRTSELPRGRDIGVGILVTRAEESGGGTGLRGGSSGLMGLRDWSEDVALVAGTLGIRI